MKKLMCGMIVVLGTVVFSSCGNSGNGTDSTNAGSNGTPAEMGTDADSTTTPDTDATSTQDSAQ